MNKEEILADVIDTLEFNFFQPPFGNDVNRQRLHEFGGEVISRALDAYALHIVRECVPKERPDSECRCVGTEEGCGCAIHDFNDAREQTLKNAEALLTPPTEK